MDNAEAKSEQEPRAGHWTEAPIEDVGDAIVAALAAGGIDHLFFTSGAEIGFYQEAIAKARIQGTNLPMRLVTVPHEHVSLNAALGFAAVSGRPAATAAHVDCGTMHYGGAVHTAWRSGLPVIITAGFPPTAYAGTMKGSRDEGGHLWMQETFDQTGILRNFTKWSHQLAFQDNPGLVVSRAIQVAKTEPCGPVYLTVPKELSLAAAREKRFPTADQLGIPYPTPPHPEAVRVIAERLLRAEQPVVVVSGSGRNPDALPALVELCELLGLAVVDAVQRGYLCFPSRHPLYQPATHLPKTDAILVLDADVPWVPGRNSPPESTFVAAIAPDAIELRIPIYDFTADLRITADPLLSIRAIAAEARRLMRPDDEARIAARAKTLQAASRAWIEGLEADAISRSDVTPIDTLWLSYQIGKAIDDNCIVLDDTLALNRVREFIPCTRPGSYFINPGSSGGWAPGAAFGAKLAAPDRDVIAVTGDGFYMFGTPAPALWAGAQHGAPFMVVVYTNRSYTTGTSRLINSYGPGSYAAKTGFEGGYFDPPIDFAKEAEAAGAYGETVRDPAEIGPALQRGLAQIRTGRCAVISVWLKRIGAAD